MSMISEQVRTLREEASWQNTGDIRLAGMLYSAADTIESLGAKLAQANMERSEQYYGGGWISIEDRLPKESGKYLVTGTWKGESIKVWVCDFWKNEIYSGWINDARNPIVAAWMPLPEPYKEDKS